MILLLAFAFLAGAATAITPCVLPVLPALLSASGTGGRRRPIGIVTGLTLTHTITIVGVASVVDGVGVGDSALRTAAIVVLALFGVTLLVPRAAEWVTLRLSFLQRLAPRGDAGGLLVGPAGRRRAGLRLRPVRRADPRRGHLRQRLLGHDRQDHRRRRRLRARLGARPARPRARRPPADRPRAPRRPRRDAAAQLRGRDGADRRADVHERRPALPGGACQPLPVVSDEPDRRAGEVGGGRERARAAARQAALPGAGGHGSPARGRQRRRLPGVTTPQLPKLGVAPEFDATQRWFNTTPLTMTGLRGRVVLVDFWTYTCINCIRTMPYLKAWDARYREQGLTIVGVHTPEFAFERRTPTSPRRSGARACATPSSRTTSSGRGTRFATPTGRRSTSSTRAGRCATCTSARATTRRPRR